MVNGNWIKLHFSVDKNKALGILGKALEDGLYRVKITKVSYDF